MQKNYFHKNEVDFDEGIFVVEFQQEKEYRELLEKEMKSSLEMEEESEGPSIQSLREEAESFKEEWELEKASMIEQARNEAESIINNAENKAKLILSSAQEDSSKIKLEAQEYKNNKEKELEKTTQEMISNAELKTQDIEKKAYEEGLHKGLEDGYLSGEKEVNRLIDRMHFIISKISAKRTDILNELETQVVDLAIKISKKVIKTLSSSNEEFIVSNTLAALDKLKVKSDIRIRANMTDINLLTEQKEYIIKEIEKITNVEFIEDSNIEAGGCIVETDFGEIDARISSQLSEIEKKILESTPIRSKGSSFRFK